MPHRRGLLAELRRRGVWRAAAVYAGAAFVAVEAVDLFAPNLGLPEWTVRAAAVLAVAGFPVAVLLAWVFDLTREGVLRTEEDGEPAAIGSRRFALIGLGAFTIAVAAAGWWVYAGEASPPEIRRLAVLPLANLMDDPEQAYFVEGMHDRLISELQQAGVPVIARTSVMRYAGGDTPIREIGAELGVDAIIEASVFRAGERVTIDARLVNAASEEYLWQESFAGDLRDVVAIHRDLTRAIADEIRRVLSPGVEVRLAESAPVDPEAYEAYLRGMFHLQRFTPQDLDAAVGYFERAIAIDSVYAPAWVGLARARHRLVGAGRVAPGSWEPSLERALELDPGLAEAYFMVAMTTAWDEWDWEGAERAFRRGILLNPSEAEGRMFYGHLLTILGRWEEGAEQAETGLRLDPLNPFIQGMYAVRLVMVRRYDEAITRLEELARQHPGAGFGRGVLAATLRDLGRHEESIDQWRAEFRLRDGDDVVEALERGYQEGGAVGAYRGAAEALAERASDEWAPAVQIASHYVHAGEPEKALDWLELGLEEPNANMPYIGVIPTFEPLHDHPRFREIAGRIGVPVLEGPAGG